MHILLLDCGYGFNFEDWGHTVSRVTLTDGETPLDRICASLASPPDLLIQQESLLNRRFITGLESAPFPTLFFTFDTHLNLFWQQYYTRLFDAVLCPHPSLFRALPENNASSRIIPMPHAGYALPWKPHAGRKHDLVFCGRLTKERPTRENMAHLLQERHSLRVAQGISLNEMLALYADSRIIPNEAICYELNLRLLEGASAGAAMLSPDCGTDQSAVFTDGKEMLVYHDGLDLCEKISWLKNNPALAEKMGKAAHDRVQREHLPVHRAKALLDLLPTIGETRAKARESALFSWLMRLERTLMGDNQYPVSVLLEQSAALPETPETLAGICRLLGKPAKKEPALAFCRQLLLDNTGAESSLCNAAASACAMAHGDFYLARQFWVRNNLHAGAGRINASMPESASALCIAWARSERHAGRVARPGFPFQADKGHLPACALEFLLFAKHLAPDSSQDASAKEKITEAEIALCATFPAYSPHRLSLMESAPSRAVSWRALLDRGLLLLFCCRVEEGIGVIARAGDTAAAKRQSAAFSRALAAWPSHMYIIAALKKSSAPG
ncbi:hypothetical protein FACS1894206_04380 [Deltaproteobacteria bacterium]|nr:hypothetical protein FACS1894206_04380 [Deltaproteobacteria bacterium]